MTTGTFADNTRRPIINTVTIYTKRDKLACRLHSYLYVTIVSLRNEWHADGEEVVWLACYTELKAARLVLHVHHRQTPLQNVPSAVVPILPIKVSDHRGTHSRPTKNIYHHSMYNSRSKKQSYMQRMCFNVCVSFHTPSDCIRSE